MAHAEHFDHVVLATHPDQALRRCWPAQPARSAPAGRHPLPGQRSRAAHRHPQVLPRARSAWAAWNYERAADPGQESARVCLHYLAQPPAALPFTQPVIVSLNPVRPLRRSQCIGRYTYAHPCSTGRHPRPGAAAAVAGRQHTWFCGAWMGYGFHEDGLKAGRKPPAPCWLHAPALAEAA